MKVLLRFATSAMVRRSTTRTEELSTAPRQYDVIRIEESPGPRYFRVLYVMHRVGDVVDVECVCDEQPASMYE